MKNKNLILISLMTIGVGLSETPNSPTPFVPPATAKANIQQVQMQADYWREWNSYNRLQAQFLQALTPEQKKAWDDIQGQGTRVNAAAARLFTGYCGVNEDFDRPALEQKSEFGCVAKAAQSPPSPPPPVTVRADPKSMSSPLPVPKPKEK
jgi:hypothetical protein